MDNELPSSLGSTTDTSSDESFHEDLNQNSETCVARVNESASTGECCNDSETPKELDINFPNFPGLQSDLQNEEEKYEKLSEVIEEPEDFTDLATNASIVEATPRSMKTSEKSRFLQERISALNEVIISLREELDKEVSLLRKERDEFQTLQEKKDLFALEEATAAARAAAEAYAAESPLSERIDGLTFSCFNFPGEILDVNPEQALSELTILEYEKRLAKYQDALALAQAEKRFNMRRQLAVNTYHQKLMEVERLCDEELEKIKQNANFLQPLKQIASQWYNDDRCGGDADKSDVSPRNVPYKSSILSEKASYTTSMFRGPSLSMCKVDAEVNMTPEMFGAKFKVEDTDCLMYSKPGTTNWMNNDFDQKIPDAGSSNPLSVKWDSSNFTLSTTQGNP
ncbi:uncharacterized protein LOC105693323 [Athalia rosae]|uniref:uncharacterized protein LOC105693323 n=1 Tax=Athalia rosae TaxID=37344 RepID=UPI00203493B9|nr:uncharacterized protein LOC105693323 [Athalia rosae]